MPERSARHAYGVDTATCRVFDSEPDPGESSDSDLWETLKKLEAENARVEDARLLVVERTSGHGRR